jgi:small conductance mechanosensitive channel
MFMAAAPLTDLGGRARGSGLEIVLLVTGAILLTRFATWLGGRIIQRIDANAQETDALVRSEAAKHRHALAQVVTWATLVLIYCVTAVLIVQRLGVPVTSLVAPATIVGVALGFGAQRLVQDILAGFFIITERQYGFGDVIRIAIPGTGEPVSGTVEDVTLRITRIRSVNGEVMITPNGQIVQVTNLSRDWARAVVDVPVPASVDVNRVNEIHRRVGEETYEDPELHPLLLDQPSVMGVESIEVDQFEVRLVARCPAGSSRSAGRCAPASRPRSSARASICRPTSTRQNPPGPADAPARPTLDLAGHRRLLDHTRHLHARPASTTGARRQRTGRHGDHQAEPDAGIHSTGRLNRPAGDADREAADPDNRSEPHHPHAHGHGADAPARLLEPRGDVAVTSVRRLVG